MRLIDADKLMKRFENKSAETNGDRIRKMTDEDLAKISTYCTTKPDYDCFEIEEWHSVFTADLYDSEEDAISYTIDWLNQSVEEEQAK